MNAAKLQAAIDSNKKVATEVKGLAYIIDTAKGNGVPQQIVTQSLINIVANLFHTQNDILKLLKDEHERSQQS